MTAAIYMNILEIFVIVTVNDRYCILRVYVIYIHEEHQLLGIIQ